MKNVNKAKLLVQAAVILAVTVAFVMPGAAGFTNQIVNQNSSRPLLRGEEWIEQASGFATPSRGIRFLDAVDQNIAWAISYDGSGGGAPTTDMTMTSDGGTTWIANDVIAGNYGLGNICGLDAQIAYVALFCYSTQNPTCGIYKTSDGGSSWTQLTSNPISFANNAWFWNEMEGVALGDTKDGYFEDYTTQDGGITWQRVPQVNFTGLPVGSGEAGWTGVMDVIGDTIIFGTNTGNAYISHDRGHTYFSAFTGASTGGLNAGVNELAFKDSMHGLAAHDNGASYDLFETSDGGVTWTPIAYSGTAYSAGLSYLPGTDNMYVSTGGASGASGASYSLDGGHTWIDYEEMYDIQMLSVDFVEGKIGWAGAFNIDEITGGMFKHLPGDEAPAFTITITGGTGVTVDIKNVGELDATNVAYSITIEGGLFVKPRETTGTEAILKVGNTTSVAISVFGIGLGIITPMPQIKVHVDCDEGVSADKNAYAKIFFSKVTLQ